MSENDRTLRHVGEFFNDGHWYVLTSTSLGGSGLDPESISARLTEEGAGSIPELLRDGVCLPLYFDCDCAMDDAVIMVGDLSAREEDEWIARIRTRLEIPCGEFVFMGGGADEHFEEALATFEAENPDAIGFVKVRVPPGTYLVEVYAFLGSFTVNEHWERSGEDGESLERWWRESRPSEEPPAWIEQYRQEDYVESEQGYLEYLVRLAPFAEEVPLPALEEDTGWCGVFETRRPEKCPQGILLNDLVPGAARS